MSMEGTAVGLSLPQITTTVQRHLTGDLWTDVAMSSEERGE